MEFIKCRHKIASVSPQPRHSGLKCLYRFDPTFESGLVPGCCTSMFTAVGIGLIALSSGPQNCCRCQLSCRLQSFHVQFFTRPGSRWCAHANRDTHARSSRRCETRPNGRGQTMNQTSHAVRAAALAPFFFPFVSQYPLSLARADNFPLAYNCSTRHDAVRNNDDSPRDCVRSRGSHCLRRQLSVRFSSTGWGKNKTKHLANSCTGPATRSSSALLPAALCSSVRSLFHQFKVYRTDA